MDRVFVSPPPGIAVHAASLRFAGQTLFDDLDMVAPGGRFTCILGPSGVGKTTLLRLVAGLETGADGTRIGDEHGGSLEGRCAYMAQQDLLLPWLNVVDNALLGFRLRGEADLRQRSRAVGLLTEAGLCDALNKRPAALSGGMRQRVALVRTLLEDRPVVLMDEPFSALDVVTRLRLQDLAARLLAGRTVLLITHDPLEALRLGHRIHVLAGSPARLDAAIEPPGPPPRNPLDPAVLRLQGELLERLGRAADAEDGGT